MRSVSLATRIPLSLLLIAFGMVKVVPTQFVTFTLPSEMLVEVGQSTGPGMLWKFMATSTVYTVITGLVEVAAGVLLIFRHTALLGALVGIVALVQVCVLNFSYGVPVRVVPVVMLIMAVVVTVPWWSRLVRVLLDGDAVRVGRIGVAVWCAAAVAVGVFMADNGIRRYHEVTHRQSEQDGVWQVDSFDGARPWSKIAIDDRPGFRRLVVKLATGDVETRALDEFRLEPAGDRLVVTGAGIRAHLHRIPQRVVGNEFR